MKQRKKGKEREEVEVEHHSPIHVHNENQKEIEKAARIGKDPTAAYQPVKETSQPDCFHYKKDQYQRGSFCDYWHHGGRSAFLCTHSAVGDEKKKRSGITNIAVNTEVTQELSCVLKENRGYKFTIRPILQQVGVQPTRGHFEFRCWQHC